MTREEIKERIKVQNNKIKRYQRRINHYQQNRTFKNNQGKFYRELNSGGRNYETTEVPNKKEAHEFWEVSGEKEKNTGNMPTDLKISRGSLNTKKNKKKKILRKMPNWKASGPDCVQCFWLKIFKSIQEGLTRNLQKCLENGNVPMWMANARTILMQKDKKKGQDSK